MESSVCSDHQIVMANSKKSQNATDAKRAQLAAPETLPVILVREHDGTIRRKRFEEDFPDCKGMIFVGMTGPQKPASASADGTEGVRKRSETNTQPDESPTESIKELRELTHQEWTDRMGESLVRNLNRNVLEDARQDAELAKRRTAQQEVRVSGGRTL
jgi:hypothetical protein